MPDGVVNWVIMRWYSVLRAGVSARVLRSRGTRYAGGGIWHVRARVLEGGRRLSWVTKA